MTKSIVLTTLFAAVLASPAHAQELTVSVGYSDLDLASESGVARLDHRIDSAIATVCDDGLGQKSTGDPSGDQPVPPGDPKTEPGRTDVQ